MKNINLLLIAFLLILIYPSSWSCTGLQIKSKNGAFINGRTVEFDIDLHVSGLIVPRNYTFHGTLPDGKPGLSYVSKYAFVGAGMFGEEAVADGINEKGLSVGDFYFPKFAEYTSPTLDNQNKALSPTEFSNWILSQFATVDEVKEAINSIVIVGTIPKGWSILPPFHYVVYDKTGKSIVIEPIKGKLVVYDNPIGVLTNSPTFDWHMTNLSNYLNLSPINAPNITLNGVRITPLGQGSGLHGLPGDFTPPSRFVRATVFSHAAIPAKNAEDAVFQMFHLLNQFDIPIGSVIDINNQTKIPEYTLATTVKDPKNLNYYFRTYHDQSIKVISLKTIDVNAKEIKSYPLEGKQKVEKIG